MNWVPVELGPRRYDVVVGPGAVKLLPEVLPFAARRAAVVTQAAVGLDVDPGMDARVHVIPPGEQAKTLAVVEQLCRDFARDGLARTDVVVAVGGGVVTDVAGFAAASYHRGVAYVNVATTLLAQVDAAIGGKTGVNLPEGKNLVGAFWQPVAVLCDTDTLASLPPREWASGRGELAKYALLAPTLDARGPAADARSVGEFLDAGLDEQVARAASMKAQVVVADEHEGGQRALLNYGHTLAHALEAAALGPHPDWDLRHGEAVAVGLVFAARLAAHLGRVGPEVVETHRQVVAAFELHDELPAGAGAAELLSYMARDKKAHHDLTFVLDGPSGIEPVSGVSPDAVTETLRSMGAGA